MSAQVTKTATQKPMSLCLGCLYRLSEMWMGMDAPETEPSPNLEASVLAPTTLANEDSKKEQDIQQTVNKDELPSHQSQKYSQFSQNDSLAETLVGNTVDERATEDGAPLGTEMMTNTTNGESSDRSQGNKDWSDSPDTSSHIPGAPTPVNSPRTGPRREPTLNDILFQIIWPEEAKKNREWKRLHDLESAD